MDALFDLVRDYGFWVYLLLFAYCAFKSGSLPLFAGYAAQAQALELVPVAIATFAGGYLGDEIRFWATRRYGVVWVSRWPRLQQTFNAAKLLADRYGWAYVFLYRYPKGMRTIGALPMGLGNIPWRTFTLLNGASALLWTSILVGVGFAFGAQLENAISAGWSTGSVVLLCLMLAAILIAWKRIDSVNAINGSTR